MRTSLLTALVAAAIAVGCGGDPAPAGDGTAPPPPAQDAQAPAQTDEAAPAADAPAPAPPAPSGDDSAAPAPGGRSPVSRLTPDAAPGGTAAAAPTIRPITLPAGTELPLRLETALASDTASLEDPVRATLRRDVAVDGVKVLPAGTVLRGVVTVAERSGKVKGRARLAFRFTDVEVDGESYRIRTSSVIRNARGTKKEDATKIGIGAGAGAIVGGIVGGGKGAAIGSAVGAGAGTGAVLATRGEEVQLSSGTPVTVRLSEAVPVRVRLDR